MSASLPKQPVTLYNVFVVACATLASILLGYASGVIGSTLGQASWYRVMGLQMVPGKPGYSHTETIQGASDEHAANGTFYAFATIGTILIGEIMGLLGRIRAFQIASALHIVGAAIQTGSVNQAMFLVGRGITGLAAGSTIVIGPVYFSEVAPPSSRGSMAGMHGAGINTGYMLAAWVGFGSSYANPTTTFGFRFPLAIPILIALIILGATLWMPESPRHLVDKGRSPEALAVLTSLHGHGNHEFAQRELREIELQVAEEKAAFKEKSAFMILFTQMTYLKRVALGILVCSGVINTGVLVINNYAVIIYSSLGLSTTVSLLLSAVWLTLAAFWNWLGAFLSDRVGRRRILLIGNIGTTAMLIIFTGLYAKFQETGERKYATACLVFNFAFELFFGAGVDPHVYTVAAEIFPVHLRAKGESVALAGYYIYSIIWTEAAPPAFSSIGWKFYLVFICIQFLQITLIYLYLPETANVPLEEIDEVFGGQVKVHLNDADLIVEPTSEEVEVKEAQAAIKE
ncbi:hypothetical protein Z517_00635 [Fonsecaea pedrosoi CBS 271.37]|uniref:Major facilitator superfamily (MFS) profile domain-containing protein n=1 Tax=Fonsecaea pedrosoi CBS 271.37 TaxID=1442368 RepID=A0A0D2H314_9EURO|nr:uncharacterized protein Z517_00635 [Fonsecaea pedrosoi CBS 271.37]KIW85245.1 hypothetical protein Z517_00635 [Fonsecaea pedrosoi CBS 271.37]